LTNCLLFNTRYVIYFVAFFGIFFMKKFNGNFGMRNLLSLSMECSCITPLILAMMAMSGFHF
jgi:hypothetical protein